MVIMTMRMRLTKSLMKLEKNKIPVVFKMMNQQRMIKLVRLMSVARWVCKVSLRLEEKFVHPEATCNWGQTLTIRYFCQP